MTWLNHPRFVRARDGTLDHFRAREYHFRKANPLVFLCGGRESCPRDWLAKYLGSKHPDFHVFYADEVWSLIAESQDLNALQMEEKLACLADMILIVVESPGTFAELGAFSLSDRLRKKLLPIIDKKYQSEESFINTGPVRWIDKDSQFKPTLWANQSRVLEVVGELEDRLALLPRPRARRIKDLSASPKHLLFFLCDLVTVFGPSPLEHIQYFVDRVLGKLPSTECRSLVALAKTMDLMQIVPDSDGANMYYRRLGKGGLFSLRHTNYIDIASLRAGVVGVMLMIRDARTALELAGSDDGTD